MGPDKPTLGSDYPFALGELEPGQLIRSVPLPVEIKARRPGQNAPGWPELTAGPFTQTQGKQDAANRSLVLCHSGYQRLHLLSGVGTYAILRRAKTTVLPQTTR